MGPTSSKCRPGVLCSSPSRSGLVCTVTQTVRSGSTARPGIPRNAVQKGRARGECKRNANAYHRADYKGFAARQEAESCLAEAVSEAPSA